MSLPNLHGMRMHAAITMVGSGYKRKNDFDDRPNQVHPFPVSEGKWEPMIGDIVCERCSQKMGRIYKIRKSEIFVKYDGEKNRQYTQNEIWEGFDWVRLTQG